MGQLFYITHGSLDEAPDIHWLNFSMPYLYPYYSGLGGHGLGGLKLKTQRNTHAATQWFKKKHTQS